MKYIVKVTQKHIDLGKPNDPCNCPVALALKETFKCDRAIVDAPLSGSKSHLTINDIYIVGPRSVACFLIKFDRSGKKGVKPFNFVVEL